MKELFIFANEIISVPKEKAVNDAAFYNKAKESILYLEQIKNTSENSGCCDSLIIFFYSFLYYVDKNFSNIFNILKIVLDSNTMTHYTKFFYLYQIIRIKFINNSLSTPEIQSMIEQIYIQIFEDFKNELNLTENHILSNDRNKDTVFIMTSQFLTLEHAPTKTAFFRAKSLIKDFNKKIMLINTSEFGALNGREPFYNTFCPNIINNYNKVDKMEIEDISFEFYQSGESMPNIDVIKEILNFVLKYKPYFILNIGGASIISDLCSLFVPTISQATVFSGLPLTLGTFSVTANPKMQTADNVLLTTFTFAYKPQTHAYTRKELSLPEDKFLILISGARLDEEVTYEFLSDIGEIFEYDVHIMFAGYFDNYEDVVSKSEVLKNNTTFLGFQDDMLAVSELCDLYVNPPRMGGGSSLAEALSKEKPAVTLNFGDCSIAAGEEFCVNDLNEMKEKIIKYVLDEEFYKEMSNKAVKRNEILTDIKKSLEDIIDFAENSEYWW